MKKLILEKYYNEKLSQVEIAKELNISKSTVSRIVSKDIRYQKEKADRKNKNRIKNKEFTINYINAKRKQRSIDTDYAILKHLHEQASMELSGGKNSIGNRAFRNWNSSIYKYNDKRKSYILKKGIIVGTDVPRIINWRM